MNKCGMDQQDMQSKTSLNLYRISYGMVSAIAAAYSVYALNSARRIKEGFIAHMAIIL